jgi:hypothetical protein
MVQSQPWQIVLRDLTSKKKKKKKTSGKIVGGVAQGVGPEFKPQYCKKRKKEKDFVRKLPVPALTDTEFLFEIPSFCDIRCQRCSG